MIPTPPICISPTRSPRARGLCDVEAVRVLVDEGPDRVTELIAMGAAFDRSSDGRLELAREGGHTLPRVVHAGGAATGAEIERALVEAVRRSAVAVFERWFALDFIVEGGRCRGVTALAADGVVARDQSDATSSPRPVARARSSTVTTNPLESTGDGLAMALRSGVAVADIEFVQFHPTALHHPAVPRPLLSEALRGHGALLRDAKGERFVDELLPRDAVSRAMTARMLEQDVDHLWLDATGLDHFDERFPTIAAAVRQVGLDPATDWLPIAPAAHYQCGGIVTDLDGATSLPGLWAAGEVACTGIHGANRLASNSLLEGMVFGPRVIEAIERGEIEAKPTGAMRAVIDDGVPDLIAGRTIDVSFDPRGAPPSSDGPPLRGRARERLQRAMTTGAGVLRAAPAASRRPRVVVDEVLALHARR